MGGLRWKGVSKVGMIGEEVEEVGSLQTPWGLLGHGGELGFYSECGRGHSRVGAEKSCDVILDSAPGGKRLRQCGWETVGLGLHINLPNRILGVFNKTQANGGLSVFVWPFQIITVGTQSAETG